MIFVRLTGCAMLAATALLPACAAAQVQLRPAAALHAENLSVAQLRARYEDEQSRYMTIRGVEVHYKDEGTGPVLMMVHGSQSSLRTWDGIVDVLKDRYRIIRYDIPGYGLSGRVSDEVAANVDPMDLPLGLVEALGVEEMTVVGVSSGGTMGMYLAAEYPHLVKRLIISNTPSDPVDTSHLVMPQAFIDAIARDRETGFRDLEFWNQYLSYFSGDPARISPQTRQEYYDFNRREPEDHPIAMVAVIGDGVIATERMARITQPTFQIWGTDDKLLPESAANASARYLSSAQISRVLMPDVGHYPPLEVPERFAQLIAAFVEAGVPNP